VTVIWFIVQGCDGELAHPPPVPVGTETGTIEPPSEPGCRPDPANELRARCSLTRDGTGPIEVIVRQADGAESVVFTGDAGATDLEIVVWDLLALTAYEYDLVDRGETVLHGTFVTEAVRDSLRPLLEPVLDGPSSLGDDDRILFSLGCTEGPALMLVDAEGRLRWYERATAELGGISGFDLTDRGTVVAAMGRRRILEVGFDGLARADLTYGFELDRFVHHAVVGPDDRILALDTEAVEYPDGKRYLVDGVTEIAGGRAAHVWDVARILDPEGLPSGDPLYWSAQFVGAVDFAHENSIAVLDDGGWLLSFKHLDTLVRLDPDAALTPRWTLTSGTTAAVFDAPALELVSSAGLDPSFHHPHHANPSPWGTVLLVDNGNGIDTTRILELRIDEDAGQADVIAEWDLGASCPVQSSAYGRPDGTILATCSRTRELFELDRDLPGVVRRRVAVRCADGAGGSSFVRALPVTLPLSR
jgi:hypothetical protein